MGAEHPPGQGYYNYKASLIFNAIFGNVKYYKKLDYYLCVWEYFMDWNTFVDRLVRDEEWEKFLNGCY